MDNKADNADTEYRENRKKYFESMKIGQHDMLGYTISRIFGRYDDFIIYEIKTDIASESMRVMVYPEDKLDPQGLEKHFQLIKSEFNEIKAVLYKAARDNSFKHIISSAVALGILGQVDESKKMLADILRRINDEYKQQITYKISYAATCLSITTCFLIAAYITQIGLLESYIYLTPLVKHLIYMMAAGSIGGALSISIKARKLDFEFDIHKRIILCYGIERMAYAAIGSIIMYLLIQSNLFFGFVNQISKPIYGYVSFGILSGFSETLIPEILIKLEKNKQ